MEAYWLDWLSLLGRWLHLVTGIAWIGASFYFVWLDNHLLPPLDPDAGRRGIGGELWAVHGGGFYQAQKYRVAPAALPPGKAPRPRGSMPLRRSSSPRSRRGSRRATSNARAPPRCSPG